MMTTTQPSEFARRNINYNYNKKSYRKPPSAGIGKRKGTAGAVNLTIREIFAEFVYRNASTAQELYERVAKKDPVKALQILSGLADFVLPRLQRTEMTAQGPSLVSPNPIADASEAAAVYASVLGNTKFDLTLVAFAPPPQQAPVPQESVVAEQDQVPSFPRRDNVASLWERLGK